MKYISGEVVRIGDRVKLGGDAEGVVVFCVDNNEHSAEYPEADWSYLNEGAMIKFDKLGLIYFSSSDEELKLVQLEVSRRFWGDGVGPGKATSFARKPSAGSAEPAPVAL